MKIFRVLVEVLFDMLDGRLRWLLVRDTLLVIVEGVLVAVALMTVAPVIDMFVSASQQSSPLSTRLTAFMQMLRLPVSLEGLLVVFLAMQIIKSGFSVMTRYCMLQTRYATQESLMMGTFKDFVRAQWAFFSEQQQGVLRNTLSHEVQAVATAVWVTMLMCANFTQIVLYVLLSMYVSWQVTLISVVAAAACAVPFLLFGKLSYRLGHISLDALNRVSSVIHESFGMAKLILGFSSQRKSVERLGRSVETYCRSAHRSQALQSATPYVYEPLGVVVLVITALVGRSFEVPLAELAIVFWALRNCLPLLSGTIVLRNALLNAIPSYEQVRQLRQRAQVLRQPSGALPFKGLVRGITFERVSFAYPGHPPVLKEITITIPKGGMVALAGESGVGKSTLIDLLMGFYRPTAGQITIDGIPLEQLDIASYRGRIGYVPQDSALFNATILENLRWAKEDATDEEIREACRQANADEFIERFPNGYHTEVGERGVRLSGGQCQRVALARAILRKPELLILDEATSSLDTQSERLIQQAIEAVAKETTVVVIAHRLSTIVNADMIYVLQDGWIVEEGTYQTLMQRHGPFSRMTQLQVLEPVA
ncbi:MAG: ABC transporter ATP-binding protein [Candidatus Omnitrophica bacterium]|nr:ABC transporter ATP-binding protein [Candidatus Omnitrophota bacterium]